MLHEYLGDVDEVQIFRLYDPTFEDEWSRKNELMILCAFVLSCSSVGLYMCACFAGWPHCRGHDSGCEQGHTPGIRL